MCVVRRAVTTYLDRFAIFLAFLISLDKFFKYLSICAVLVLCISSNIFHKNHSRIISLSFINVV